MYENENEFEGLEVRTDRFKGLSALITGGSQGIGRRIALELASEGANIAINDLSSKKEKADSVARFIESELGGDTWIAEADVSDHDDVERMKEQVKDNFGEIDILVNNAGINRDGFLTNMEPKQWQDVIEVNLTGAFNCSRIFIDDIKASKQGRIINVSSVVGQTGNLGQVNYASSKAGLIGFTKALAREMVRYDVTVNAVAPGFIDTDMVEGIPDRVMDKILSSIPMGRLGKPSEVARLVAYLSSEEASYITGAVISINGGFYI